MSLGDGGHGLLVWRPQGGPMSWGGTPTTRRLWLGRQPREVEGMLLSPEGAIALASGTGACSDAITAWRGLFQVAHALVRRGGVRPGLVTGGMGVRLAWLAHPDSSERALIVSVVRAMPPAALAAFSDAPDVDDGWRRLRGILDLFVDRIVRSVPRPKRFAEGSFEAEVEAALAGDSGDLPRFGALPRPRRALEAWEQAVRAADRPKLRLVLRLEPSDAGFVLQLKVESREPLPDGPLPVRAIFSGEPEAHLLADELGPVRSALTELLRKAGQLLLPIELALASGRPDAASLSAEEAWAFVTRLRGTFEAGGVRVEVAPELEGLEARFPRARVRLTRDDGAPPSEASLAGRYVARWEVSSDDAPLTAAQLREAAKEAPLARIGSRWLPMSSEAGERLARIVERAEAHWTGPQALAAALAGEVRQPGDLSDAQVIAEPGLLALIAELGRDAEEIDPPKALHATLRGYQRRGLSWMFHRTRLGLGALLADDMGLGKTVQLISLLLTLRERGLDDGPTLLACPASLVGNWERELARFAPDLRVIRHHGDLRKRDARTLAAEAGPHDVVLTTYGLVRRDAALLSDVKWGTFVCDEAQNLKNPTSAQARAVRSIGARRRVGLSGTPVENRLTELWSLLEFLNPGLLGPLDRFRRELALPIERERDARAVRWLQAATRPFLLRRLKSDPEIAPELPEKEVIRVFCSLSDEQAKLYSEAVEQSLSAIDDASGIERQGRVLRLLTQLKQICNHPAQLTGEGELPGRSGKLERATEMLEEIVESGERTLVFTQYVQMAELLVRHLESRLGLRVPMFHGGLSLEQRDALVHDFQRESGGAPILVLSLKAGGVGLNLTRASHVMHFDRWWNPAVEDQATDRAHRIGQTRRVQVHHLVTMGTLEERIDRMLEEKRALAGAVIEGGESWLAKLSTDELRALVSLGSDAAVESIEAFGARDG